MRRWPARLRPPLYGGQQISALTGVAKYSNANGSSAESTCEHGRVATYHEATGHYEQVKTGVVSWDEHVNERSYYYCNMCDFKTEDVKAMSAHNSEEGSGCSVGTEWDYSIHHEDPVCEDQWVEDTAAYTTYKCSKCGATK